KQILQITYLHDFPTRRSSDLSIVWRCVSRLEEKGSECTAPTINEETLQTAVVKAINELLANKEPFLQALQKNIATILNEENDNRSEEHTSELQSRENLVCRLL